MGNLFFTKEKLNKGEVIFFILYFLISLTLFFTIDFSNDKELSRFLLLFYSYGTVLFLYISH